MLSEAMANEYSYLSGRSRAKVRKYQKQKTKYQIESHGQYDFEACNEFEKEDADPNYFIRCDESELVSSSNIDELINTSDAIEKNLYSRALLSELKSHTTQQLQGNISQLEKIKACTNLSDVNCRAIRDGILKVVRQELPKLRATMAMMNPIQNYRGMRPKLYNSSLKHEVPTTKVPILSSSERQKIKEEAQAIKYHFEQEWFAKNSYRERKNNCIEQISPNSYQFKQGETAGYSCKSFQENKLKKYVKDKFKGYREKLKNNYYSQISKNPILSHLSLTGDEDEEVIFDNINEVVTKLLNQSKESLEKIEKLSSSELSSLIRKDNIVNSYLQKKNPTKIMCDVVQEVKDDEDFNELKEDLFLAGGALIGGGICAFTAGIGCIIGVGVASEAIGIKMAQDRYEEAALSFNSGLSSARNYEQRKFERDFTLLLAPVAVIGEGIGQGVKIGAKAYRYSPSGESFDYDLVGIRQRDLFRKKASYNEKLVPKNKSDFINEYENYVLASPRLNGRWIDNAKAINAALYLDIENSALKRLNDTIGDKSYVTALTNLHKDIVSTKLNKLLEKYPEVEIEVYSDFKSVRYAFTPKDLPPKIKQHLSNDLDVVYKNANEEFANMLKQMEGIPASETPENWFQAGLGITADQAGQSARKARELNRSGEITTFGQIEEVIMKEVKEVQNFTKGLDKNHPLYQVGLLEKTTEQTFTPALPIFEVARKVSPPTNEELKKFMAHYFRETGEELSHVQAGNRLKGQYLAKQLNEKYGSTLSAREGEELFQYTNNLDSLSPGLWVKERVNANLNAAEFGGMSGDITGMGARNIRQVALDIQRANTNDPSKVIQQTRLGEMEVTGTFDSIKRNFNNTVKEVMQSRGISYLDPCSGDDCVMVPKGPITKNDEVALVKAFARQDNPAQYRLSFIPPAVFRGDRTNLAVHGELIEKELRKNLLGIGKGKIQAKELSQLTIATKMPGSINKGPVKLYVGLGKDSHLTEEQKSLIQERLKEAVSKVNKDLGAEFSDKNINYSAQEIMWIN